MNKAVRTQMPLIGKCIVVALIAGFQASHALAHAGRSASGATQPPPGVSDSQANDSRVQDAVNQLANLVRQAIALQTQAYTEVIAFLPATISVQERAIPAYQTILSVSRLGAEPPVATESIGRLVASLRAVSTNGQAFVSALEQNEASASGLGRTVSSSARLSQLPIGMTLNRYTDLSVNSARRVSEAVRAVVAFVEEFAIIAQNRRDASGLSLQIPGLKLRSERAVETARDFLSQLPAIDAEMASYAR